MNEDQARTIIGKVARTWRTSTNELLDSSEDDLDDDLHCWPVEGVTFAGLTQALDRVRRDPRWAE